MTTLFSWCPPSSEPKSSPAPRELTTRASSISPGKFDFQFSMSAVPRPSSCSSTFFLLVSSQLPPLTSWLPKALRVFTSDAFELSAGDFNSAMFSACIIPIMDMFFNLLFTRRPQRSRDSCSCGVFSQIPFSRPLVRTPPVG